MKIGSSLINARAETVASKPAFRAAYQKRRCLVPADGFYEWKKVGAGKIPHHIGMADGSPFAFAGLWEVWRDPLRPDDAPPTRTFTIITGLPNALVCTVHNRMPVIIPPEQWRAWLSPDISAEDRAKMLTPFPADRMEVHPISDRVNSPKNDDPSVLDQDPAPLEYRVKPRKEPTAAGEPEESEEQAELWLFPPPRQRRARTM
jgi:putative SOS response-associated peptidase YedK